jgi:hypothetical protein
VPTSDLLERCPGWPSCKGAGTWGATGKMPEQHTFQPNERGGYLAHLHPLSLDDLIRLYGVRCAEVHSAANESTALYYFEAAESIGREISRRWDELVKQASGLIQMAQELNVQTKKAQDEIRRVLRTGV